MQWHEVSVGEAYDALGTSAEGLSAAEASRRLQEYGSNSLREQKKKTVLSLFAAQFTDFMILVLITAAVISGFIGEVLDTIVILVIVVVNAIIGFVQEFRAEKAMAALKRLSAPLAVVIRAGERLDVDSATLVPGDVCLIDAGRIVPADLRISESVHLRVEESALTGESVPVDKVSGPLPGKALSLGERANMAYRGTTVTYGRGIGVVVATGMRTELGRVASMLEGEEEMKTPLQQRLTVFGRKLAVAVLIVCATIFIAGIFRGEPMLLMFLTAVSLAVAAIPEALPAVVTVVLALGAKKMVRANALVRKLSAVETLGSVTFICTDKTGTLTMNRMAVEKMYVDGNLIPAARGLNKGEHCPPPLALFMTGLALSNNATVGASGNVAGDPTEVALYVAARDHGFDRAFLEKEMPAVGEIPFDSERKCMTTFHEISAGSPLSGGRSGYISFTKGAVEAVLERAENVLSYAGPAALNRDLLVRVNDEMAEEGLRVICIAMREWERLPEDMSAANVERKLTVLGLAGMIDPPREEVVGAVSACKAAGIIPVMITGDHVVTACAIARRIGITEGECRIMTGSELAEVSGTEFEDAVEGIRVYARVVPEQKLKIVRALQKRGQYVAMTGDGVNDAPALKSADIGVAMGITGTDVAKESAHMILLDDNFATIVSAVREGRRIYDNIRKFVKYLLTTNSGEIWTLFLAPFIGLPVPLLPIQILWINLMTDSLPALALSVEPAEGDLMKRPPRPPGESIFAHGLGLHALWVGLLMGLLVLGVQKWSMGACGGHWQSMVFTVLCLSQLGHVLAIRSETRSLYAAGLFSNMPLLFAVLLCFGLQMAVIYVPDLHPVFKTAALTPKELLITLGLSSVVFIAVEIEKMVKRLLRARESRYL